MFFLYSTRPHTTHKLPVHHVIRSSLSHEYSIIPLPPQHVRRIPTIRHYHNIPKSHNTTDPARTTRSRPRRCSKVNRYPQHLLRIMRSRTYDDTSAECHSDVIQSSNLHIRVKQFFSSLQNVCSPSRVPDRSFSHCRLIQLEYIVRKLKWPILNRQCDE